MIADPVAQAWRRRARPLLGTLVEVGFGAAEAAPAAPAEALFEAAFAAVMEVQRALSRFDPESDVSRFHALPRGQSLQMRPATRAVLTAAAELQRLSGGDFDIALASAPQGWQCEGDLLHKRDAATRLDAGGIAKGHAVDLAVQALIDRGCAAGWVNAGGDLRVFGHVDLPVQLRDEATGGVRPFARLRDAAFATSHFGPGSRSALVSGRRSARTHVSVAAPLCLWADALTKIVAIRGDTADAILTRFQACAWQH